MDHRTTRNSPGRAASKKLSRAPPVILASTSSPRLWRGAGLLFAPDPDQPIFSSFILAYFCKPPANI